MLLAMLCRCTEISYPQFYRSRFLLTLAQKIIIWFKLNLLPRKGQNQLTNCQGLNNLALWEQNHFYLASSLSWVLGFASCSYFGPDMFALRNRLQRTVGDCVKHMPLGKCFPSERNGHIYRKHLNCRGTSSMSGNYRCATYRT